MRLFRSALVTGATGFIGSVLVKRLLAEQVEVTCLIRSKHRPTLADSAIRIIEVPSFDLATLKTKLAGLSADAVFNLASFGVQPQDRDPHKLIDGNVGLLTNLLAATANWPMRRFIHAGSCSEYGPPSAPGVLISENQPLRPTSMYGAAKAAAFLFGSSFASHLGVPFLTARLFGVYGTHEGPQRLIPYIVDRLQQHRPVDLTLGEQVRDLLFEDDVAEAFIEAAEAEELKFYEAYNVCSARPVRVRELGEKVANALNRPQHLLGWGERPYRADEPMWSVGDNRLFRAATAWRPRTPIEDGILRVISSRKEVEQVGERHAV
jgi:nucleoside-diphosphate-sugar epimerase